MTSEIPEGCGKKVEAHGRSIAIFKDRGALFAIDDVCPHRGGPLHQGDIEGGAAICPLHGWAFDLATDPACHCGIAAGHTAIHGGLGEDGPVRP